jgi:hypothetical protein
VFGGLIKREASRSYSRLAGVKTAARNERRDRLTASPRPPCRSSKNKRAVHARYFARAFFREPQSATDSSSETLGYFPRFTPLGHGPRSSNFGGDSEFS